MYKSKHGVNEDKITSWLLAAKRDWISDPGNQQYINQSLTFGKGSDYDGKQLNKNWWSRHLRQLISVNLVDIVFDVIRTDTFSNAVRRYTLSDKGEEFLSKGLGLLVMSPFNDPFGTSVHKSSITRESPKGGRGIHLLPKIRKAMSSSKNWFKITDRSDFEYPGFQDHPESIGYHENLQNIPGFGAHQRQHFMWEDNQLTKRHTNTRKLHMLIDGKNTEVLLRRAPCEGVKVCGSERCLYTVCKRQKNNKCQEHRETHLLKATGTCPVHMIYVWPANDDGRRWIGVVHGQEHNHRKPAPHILSQELKHRIGEAVQRDSSLTTKDLQKGFGIGKVPGEISPAAVNPERIRRERKAALDPQL